MDELAGRIRSGDMRALARGLRVVEDRRPGADALLAALAAHTGGAHRVGVTGPPGVGKSTLVGALVGMARRQQKRVGVLAVDPSSPLSGGALLGDRIRMSEHFLDTGVFLRSMASREALGGLGSTAGEALDLMDAAGYDLLLLETAGAGQTDHEVAAEADTTLVVLGPGAGDGIQAMKSGLLEVAHLWVVNKGDQPAATQVQADVRAALSLRPDGAQLAKQVLLVSATSGTGLEDLVLALDARWERLRASPEREDIRRRRFKMRMRAALRQLAEACLETSGVAADAALTRVLEGDLSVREAALGLLFKDHARTGETS